MKKTLLTLLVIFTATFYVLGQTEKGKKMAGGSVGINFGSSHNEFSGTKGPKMKFFYIDFEPKAAYFILDGVAVGLELDLSRDVDDYSDVKETYNSITIGPFARYYHPTNFFGEVSLGFGGGKLKEEEEGETDEAKYSIFEWSLGAGYAFFINDNASIEPMITYSRSTENNSDADYKYKLGEMMIEVGFNYYF